MQVLLVLSVSSKEIGGGLRSGHFLLTWVILGRAGEGGMEQTGRCPCRDELGEKVLSKPP